MGLQTALWRNLQLITSRLLVITAAAVLTSFVPLSRDGTVQSARRSAAQAPGSGAEIIVSADIGKRVGASLSDGTDLVLNTATRVRANVNAGSREIVLEQGELLADVKLALAKEYSALPVVLRAGDVDVETITGTLRIRVGRGGETIVDVLNGASILRPAFRSRFNQLQAAGHSTIAEQLGASNTSAASFQPVKLVAGQSAHVRSATLIVTSFEPAQIERALAWQEGQIVFGGETLSEAVEEFNRYNRQKLVVADAGIAKLRMGGRFETTDVEGFVSALQNTFGVRAMVVRSGGAGASMIVLMPPENRKSGKT
jgi:transmembrane sensor